MLTLTKRLEWRGFRVEVSGHEVGEILSLAGVDLIFGGGGQDAGQIAVAKDLQRVGSELVSAARDGLPMLTVCGTYQLFGRDFITKGGERMPGIGIFRAETHGTNERLIGNVVVSSPWGELVGFENHSGQTWLDDDQPAIGQVMKGYGNNASSGLEGAVAENTFGTYLHGPILPKNPGFADHLIVMALERKGLSGPLQPLDDAMEQRAAQTASARPQ